MTITASHSAGASPRTIVATAAAAGLALVLSIVLPLTLHDTTTVVERSVPAATTGVTAPSSYPPVVLRQAHGG